MGVAPVPVKDSVEFDRELMLALKAEGDRQFHTRMLLAKLGELAVSELCVLLDEIAKRPL